MMLLHYAENSTQAPDVPFNGLSRTAYINHLAPLAHHDVAYWGTEFDCTPLLQVGAVYILDFVTSSADWAKYHAPCWSTTRVLPVDETADYSWLFAVVHSTDDDGEEPLLPTIDGVNRLISSKDFSGVARVLEAIPIATANRYALLAIARATFPIRSQVVGWKKFIEGCKIGLQNRGLNADLLLKGLM